MRIMTGMSVVLLAASSAAAQQIRVGEVEVLWNFVEVIAGTNTPVTHPNGVIEPGEGARLELTIQYSPPAGTVVNYSAPPGSGVGQVAGLASIIYDLAGITPGWEGTWSHLSRRGGWGLGSAGSPGWGGNGIEFLQAGQFPFPGQVANPMNPAEAIWSGVWTPAVYSQRSTVFRGQTRTPSYGSGLYVQYDTDPVGGHPLYVSVRTLADHHHAVEIPIVPAPGPAVVGLLALGLGARRGRR
jgi:hypothetical protein